MAIIGTKISELPQRLTPVLSAAELTYIEDIAGSLSNYRIPMSDLLSLFSVDFGSDTQIPIMNASGDNFVYTPTFTFNTGTNLLQVLGDVSASAFNGVVLTTGGSATNFLNEAGNYVAVQSVSLGTSGQVPRMNATDDDFIYDNNFIYDGITFSISGDVDADSFNQVALTTGGSATNFLNEAGNYVSVPAGVSFGSSTQIPSTNLTNDDFDYTSNFIYDSTNGVTSEGTQLGGIFRKSAGSGGDVVRIATESVTLGHLNGTENSEFGLNAASGHNLVLGINNNDYFVMDSSDGGIVHNSATGGNQGAGTINVSGGFYVNGVLVTGGGGPSFGANNQVPSTNATTDDFDYSSSFTFNGSTLGLGDIQISTSGVINFNDSSGNNIVSGNGGGSANIAFEIFGITQGNDTGTSPALRINSASNIGGSLSTRPLIHYRNGNTVYATIEADTGMVYGSTTTGGSQGIGTINAKGFFIDGVAVGGGLANLEDSGASVQNSVSGTGSFTWEQVSLDGSNISISDNTTAIHSVINTSASAQIAWNPTVTIEASADTGTSPVVQFQAGIFGGGVLANRPAFEFDIDGTSALEIAANGGFVMNGATGGSQGVGTINASGGFYVNGVLVGGGGVSFGAATQIPITNGSTDDFDYSSNFTYNTGTNTVQLGTTLSIQGSVIDNQGDTSLNIGIGGNYTFDANESTDDTSMFLQQGGITTAELIKFSGDDATYPNHLLLRSTLGNVHYQAGASDSHIFYHGGAFPGTVVATFANNRTDFEQDLYGNAAFFLPNEAAFGTADTLLGRTSSTGRITNVPRTEFIENEGNTGTGSGYEIVTVEIGNWNMDLTAFVNVGLPSSITDFEKIRQVEVMIVNDGGTSVDRITRDGNWTLSSTNIQLSRVGSGFFDSANYDDGGINRGWVSFISEG